MEKSKKILILDDDIKFKSLLENLLQKNTEFKVILASNGDQALELLENKESDTDLVTTDLIHSGIGGIEFIKALKEKFPQIKIIICTGLPDLHTDFIGLSDAILYKPFKFEDFLSHVNRLLNA